mmetsp:Transcript_48479/g.128422  ORF Transcript_48479/g.128422 Transcript_48479/m.128422 type:complete len:216 (-) Transcript_48479:472-1119(-)
MSAQELLWCGRQVEMQKVRIRLSHLRPRVEGKQDLQHARHATAQFRRRLRIFSQEVKHSGLVVHHIEKLLPLPPQFHCIPDTLVEGAEHGSRITDLDHLESRRPHVSESLFERFNLGIRFPLWCRLCLFGLNLSGLWRLHGCCSFRWNLDWRLRWSLSWSLSWSRHLRWLQRLHNYFLIWSYNLVELCIRNLFKLCIRWHGVLNCRGCVQCCENQ